MYVTKQGECWDEIAKNVYGSEKYIGFLMQNNMKYHRNRWCGYTTKHVHLLNMVW